jgi:PAS domain S-box-containing protein
VVIGLSSLAACISPGDRLSPAPRLSESDRAWLAEHGHNLSVAINRDIIPFDYVDDDGHHRGVAAEYLEEFEGQLGVTWQRRTMGSWAQTLEAARRGQVDLIPLIEVTPRRQEHLNFTAPVLRTPLAIVSRRSGQSRQLTLADLRHQRTVVVEGYSAVENLGLDDGRIPLVYARNIDDAMTQVAFGEADVTLVDLASATHIIAEAGLNNLRVAGRTGYGPELGFAVRKDLPELHRIISAAVAAIPQERRRVLRNHWIHLESGPLANERRLLLVLVGHVAGALVVFCCVVVWNWTLRRRVRRRTRQLTRAHELLENIFERSPSIMVLVDSNGLVQRWNVAAEKTAGQPLESLPSRHGTDISFLAPLDALARSVAATGQVKTTRCTVRGPTRHRHYDANLFPVVTEDGTDVVIRMDDVTVEVVHEQQLERSQRMETVDSLSSGIAHEFNNMLSGIVGVVSLLVTKVERNQVLNTKEIERPVRLLEKTTNSAVDIVKKMLALSRCQAPRLERLELNRVLEQVLEICQHSFPKSVEVQFDLWPEDAWIWGDAQQLEQALLNVLINGAHAMTVMVPEGRAQGGKLRVSLDPVAGNGALCTGYPQAAQHCDYWRVAVADSGVGIPPDVLTRVFDPFFTTKAKGTGTGLGLPTLYNTLKKHHGWVDVNSRPGEGTTVTLFFPWPAHETVEDQAGKLPGAGTCVDHGASAPPA